MAEDVEKKQEFILNKKNEKVQLKSLFLKKLKK